jgi:hypothetical protein
MPGYTRRYYGGSRSYTGYAGRRSTRTYGGFGGRRYGGGYVPRRFAEYVRDYVTNKENKQLGLQTRQLQQTGSLVASSPSGAYLNWASWRPLDLRTTGILTTGSNEKVSMRTMAQRMVITNQSNIALHIRVVKYEYRRNDTNSISTLLSDGAPSPTSQPYLDPTTSAHFRRVCRIRQNKVMILAPGGTMQYADSAFYPQGRVFTGDVEGSSNLEGYKGMLGTFILVATVPVTEINEAGVTTDTGSFNATVSYVWTRYSTYYLHEDNDPSSTSTSGLSNAVSSTMIYGVPPTQRGADLNMPPEGVFANNVRQPPVLTEEI